MQLFLVHLNVCFVPRILLWTLHAVAAALSYQPPHSVTVERRFHVQNKEVVARGREPARGAVTAGLSQQNLDDKRYMYQTEWQKLSVDLLPPAEAAAKPPHSIRLAGGIQATLTSSNRRRVRHTSMQTTTE